jgi:hypothetical protein
MARQLTGFITGTIDDLTFYKMSGAYYARQKSSLTRKRFQKDKAFERSRVSASRFATGNSLASAVYRMLPAEKKSYPLFCFVKKKAIQLLKQGYCSIETRQQLIEYLYDFGLLPKPGVEAELKTGMLSAQAQCHNKQFDNISGFLHNLLNLSGKYV